MKKKKIIGLILALGILGSALFPAKETLLTTAEGLDSADQYFVEFVLSDTNYKGEIKYTYMPLYDENLEVNGRQYNFNVGEVNGYALLTEIQGADKVLYEIEELYYNKQSPFDGCEGLPVYVTHGLYLNYNDGAYYNILNQNQVSEAFVETEAYKGFGYCGSGEFVTAVQTVNYSSKSDGSYSIPYDLPNYFGAPNDTTCASTAGTVVIGYYDRFCENLIPNYQVYTKFGSIIKYKANSTEISNLGNELYELMGGELEHLGTTYAEFQDGMESYITGKGYTYTTTNMFSWGSFDFDKYKSAVESGKPVVLFLSGFGMLENITSSGTTDTIQSGYTDKTHVVVGCGYKYDTYYDSNGAELETRRYLKVASGLNDYNIGYLNINGLGNIDRAIAVQIS